MSDKVLQFERKDGDIILTNEQKEFIKAIYKVAELSIDQMEVLRTIEKTWGVTLIAYERKA